MEKILEVLNFVYDDYSNRGYLHSYIAPDFIKNDIEQVQKELSEAKSEKEIMLEEDIKEVAYELLNKYRQKEFENDGRMLEFFENNIDLVALGSIADIVPLTNENRILVKYGLSVLNKDYSKRFGLGFIFNEYLKEKKISAKTISWNVAPILNAAGRMGNASVAANLILADDKYNASNFFAELKKLKEAIQ